MPVEMQKGETRFGTVAGVGEKQFTEMSTRLPVQHQSYNFLLRITTFLAVSHRYVSGIRLLGGGSRQGQPLFNGATAGSD